jgi:cation diffusion facilitator CzcD-associated flavoprotein CzcO
VTVKRADGRERDLHPHHLVFAVGFGGSVPNMPVYPGMDEFEGQVLHSSQHNKAIDHSGKKVVVVGACTSGE